MRIHADTGIAEVIVPDFQLSLAIGKEGQNARLAARLSGWRVDIKSETPARGGRVRRRRRVRRGRVGREPVRRARVAAGRGWRGDLRGRGRLRVARTSAPRSATRPAATPKPPMDRHQPRRQADPATPPHRPQRDDRTEAAARAADAEPEAAAEAQTEPTAPSTAAATPSGAPSATEEKERGPSVSGQPERSCVGCGRKAAPDALERIARRPDGTVWRRPAGAGPGRLDLCRLDGVLRPGGQAARRSTGRSGSPVTNTEIEGLRARLYGAAPQGAQDRPPSGR